jgi:CBS domain-containing protein
MACVSDIIGTRELVWVPGTLTVLQAVKLMNRHHIGSVLVEGAGGGVAGILTERDLLTRVLAAERDPKTTLVSEVMTREVCFCTMATGVDEVREMFRSRRIRHLPVQSQDGAVCAMLSIGDVNAWDAQQLAVTVTSLTEYITRG